MEVGTEISLDAPYGSFTLHNNPRLPAVFLTGGIGVTPVRSIVLQAAHDNLPHKIFLFDSNRKPEHAAFLNALMGAEVKNPNYTFIGTMTDMRKSQQAWQGETGHITPQMLMKWIRDLKGPVYYTAGPPGMVAAMRQMLTNSNVGEDDIRTEEFTG